MSKLRSRKLIILRTLCMGTVLLKDEELAQDLKYDKKQLLLTDVATIFTWLRQLSNWCGPILTHQLTPSETVTER